MFILIIFIAILTILTIFNILHFTELRKFFQLGNVIVYGSRGKGKDVLFNAISNKDKFYYSNIPYTNKKCEIITLKDLELGDNTFNNLINNNFKKVPWRFKDNCDFYISDCGAFMPSQYDSTLHKIYPSFPITYAFSRHIGNHNIHCNSQNLERIWKALREQADTYIKCLGVSKFPFFLLLKYRIYDKYSSARNDIRPIKRGLLIRDSNLKIQDANVGLIKESWIIVSKLKTKYNSRYFKDVLIETNEQCS